MKFVVQQTGQEYIVSQPLQSHTEKDNNGEIVKVYKDINRICGGKVEAEFFVINGAGGTEMRVRRCCKVDA